MVFMPVEGCSRSTSFCSVDTFAWKMLQGAHIYNEGWGGRGDEEERQLQHSPPPQKLHGAVGACNDSNENKARHMRAAMTLKSKKVSCRDSRAGGK